MIYVVATYLFQECVTLSNLLAITLNILVESVLNLSTELRYIRCNICNYKIHINCNGTDENTYKKTKNYDESMFCVKCNQENLPFFPSFEEKHDDKI